MLPNIPTRKIIPKASKTFTVKPWNSEGEGEKILLYAETGMGKTTLASLADAVFIGLDDGGRKIKHPITGTELKHIEGIETFEDLRDALHQCQMFDDKVYAIDTITLAEGLAENFVIRTIPTGGDRPQSVKNMEGYGYEKGYKHLYDTMKLLLMDLDILVKQGKSVILIAQQMTYNVANPGGENYLCNGPRLYNSKRWSVMALFMEWADHVLRIDYQDVFVKKGKVSSDTTRVILTKDEVYYKAKSRTLTEPVISFANQQDDSLWKFIFGGK